MWEGHTIYPGAQFILDISALKLIAVCDIYYSSSS